MEPSKTRPPAARIKPMAKKLDPGKKILAALDVSVPESDLPAGYAVALGFLVACLVLLPLMYAALLTFLGWLAVWHLFQAYQSLSYGPYFVFHLPMALLGALLVLFLIKPVFFRQKTGTGGVLTLESADEPLLFAAVEKLCAATGSKMPARIEVDCQPNAHARFLRATDSIKENGDLVLRIGLPLVAALSVRQLAGVIGHELGHFNQHRGMTCSYLIRRLTGFFARIVFQRDLIDQKLAALRSRRHGGARLLYLLTLVFVEPMRGVLWLMLLAGELLTCGVLRRMEYDADNVEAHLSGVDDFIQVGQSLLLLGVAFQQAIYDLANSFNQQRLADDLPQLIVANARQLAEHRADILKLLEGGKTNWFDTHPCHDDRTANVQQLGAPGLINCPDPATALFLRFESLCQRATDSMYNGLLSKDALAGITRVPTQELADERANQRASNKALARYFSGHVVVGRPIFPEMIDPKTLSSAEALGQVKTARQAMQAKSDGLRSAIRLYSEASVALPLALSQLSLCQIFNKNPKTRSIASKMQKLIKKHGAKRVEAVALLEEFEESGRQRLTGALRLMSNAAVAERIGSEVVAGRIAVKQMLSVCAVLEECVAEVRELNDLALNLRVLHSAYNPKQPFQPLVKQILLSSRSVLKLLKALQDKLASTAFPFAHGNAGGITLAGFVVSRLPNPNDPTDTCMAAATALERYHDVTFRALSVLTVWAEKAEAAANLEPLAEPPKDPSEPQNAAVGQSPRRSRLFWIAYGSRATAGILMVTGLIYLSVNPPELPAMPWENQQDQIYHFQPQAFRIAYQPPMLSPMASPGFASTGFPSAPIGYQGRAISVQIGRPRVTLPPGFTPPSYSPPRFEQPRFTMPQNPGLAPHNFSQPAYNPPNIPQPHFLQSPQPMAPSGGQGMRSGGGGGHR